MGLIDLGWSPKDALGKVFSVPKVDLGFSPTDGIKNGITLGQYGQNQALGKANEQLREQLSEQSGKLDKILNGREGADGAGEPSAENKDVLLKNAGSAGAELGIENAGDVEPGKMGSVMIEEGQTLGGIAAEHGKSVEELMELNPDLTDPNQISAGAELNLNELDLDSPEAGGAAEPSIDKAMLVTKGGPELEA